MLRELPWKVNQGVFISPEIKFFATQVETSPQLETEIKGMYVAGDGPGVAGNIVSAAATGLIPAKTILEDGQPSENKIGGDGAV